MKKSVPFGARSTADQVLAGVDLTGKLFLVTGCNSGLGLETMNAFAANGAHVLGLAKNLAAAERACREAGSRCIPIECDLSNLESVRDAVHVIGALDLPIDGIVANAGIGASPPLQLHNGVEQQFAVNHLGHFALLNALAPMVREHSGRIVIVSDGKAIKRAPQEGILLDNLDGAKFYNADLFYAQAKLANAIFAKELAARLQSRLISVYAVNPGLTRGTRLYGIRSLWSRFQRWLPDRFLKSRAQGAATQAYVAANPQAAGITGEYWSNCQIAAQPTRMDDRELRQRLWDISVALIQRHSTSSYIARLQQAA